MLVLARLRDETIMIGDTIEVTVVDIRGDKVRLGINAPRSVSVHRGEIYKTIRDENHAAAGPDGRRLVARAGVAGALLAPRLLARPGDGRP